MKSRLKALARKITEESPAPLKVFVDTAPVMEKPLAMSAGLGWQGKHTNLVSRDFGSWLFLGEIYLSLELAPDAPEDDHCGACRACLDACPTAAFPAPYQLDARRCISYLTIEHKGHIPRELRAPIGNRLYGCDDCLAACPWNKFAQAAREARFVGRAGNAELAELVGLDDAAFRARFAGTPVKRTGRDRFIRNVLIAIGNSGDTGFVPALIIHLDDPSPLVRAMAVWALARLAAPEAFERLRTARESMEADPDVRQEWAKNTAPTVV
jgi:epoxyqueuosine reductase